MINPQAKGCVEIEPSANGGYLIRATTGQQQAKAIPAVFGNQVVQQQIFTATTIDEAMIIVREQFERLVA